MNLNPSQAPTSAADGNFRSYVVSEGTIAALRKTRPWVIFIAVCVFAVTGLSTLLALWGMLFSAAAVVGALVGAIIYVIPGVALLRYGRAINKLLRGRQVHELDEAMEAQASLWLLLGIYLLISLVISVLVLGGLATSAAFLERF